MIISDEFRYLFVEIPSTASTAISRELQTNYGGRRLLHKHATYGEFLGVATRAQRAYFAFCTVRHPLDIAVTEYFKFRTNHQGRFTNERLRGTPSVTEEHLERFRFVHDEHGDFPAFFRRFRTTVYNNYYLTLHEQLDYVIRFEQLQNGFADVLRRLSIAQVRPLPASNRTGEKAADFYAYYTPDLHDQAKRLYWPFMRRWGYTFPESWGAARVRPVSELKYVTLEFGARMAARLFHVGPNSGPGAVSRARDLVRRVWS